jgi:2-C-methyl-D-erythritol 2,4-cyclodiphosphate synthase
MRVGIGYDSHKFESGRPLILGGITIPFDKGLAGHSDADAICHAITDAMLGAAALGDIGTHFPPSDARWKNADSAELLRLANVLLDETGYRVVNLDVTVICERPKIGPHVPAIRERLAAVLGIAISNISIKGKTNEGMGWIGKGEGIATIATVMIAAAENG